MSLLDDASLLVTPNAEKEGKLYSIIPTNGNGDFTVTRATTATRVNAAGLVELVPYNLVTDSETYSSTWGSTFASITKNLVAPNGLTTGSTIVNSTGVNKSIFKTFTAISGQTYQFSVYIKKISGSFSLSSAIQLTSWGTGVASQTYTNLGTTITTDWVRYTHTFTATSNNTVYIQLISNEVHTFGLWGAQLNEGALLDYQMTETRLNIPRLDYSLGSCPNILLEPQRTNLVLRSEEFDNGSWIKSNASVTANATTSPSGLLNGDALIENTATANHEIVQTTSVTTGVSYTFAIYVKANGRDKFKIQLANQFAATALAYYDLVTGLTYSVGAAAAASMTSVGNGWFRCIITSTATSTGTAIHYSTLVSTGTTTTYLGNGTSGVFLWGAQLEAGAYATSYIPTSSASVTRNADVINKTGVSSLIGQTQGTLYGQLHIGASDSSSTVRMIASLSNGTVNNRIEIYRFNNTIQYDNVVGGAIQFSGSVATITSFNTTMRIAIKYSLNSVKFFINGVLVNTDTTALIPACSQINIGTNYAGAVAFGGFINSMALFPTPLTDTQCIALTT